LREAPSRPVLPPVEIPIGALVDTRRVIEAQSEPVAPALLVRPLQEPQVVDLEPRRAAQVTGLEVGVLAGDLAEAEFLGVPGEAGARGVVGEPRIGPLVVVHGAALRGGNRPRTTSHAAEVERPPDLVDGVRKAT